MVVKSYVEDLEGRMRLKRMWKLVPQVEKRGTNEWRSKVILDLVISPIRGFMVDRMSTAETWMAQSTERAEGARPEMRR